MRGRKPCSGTSKIVSILRGEGKKYFHAKEACWLYIYINNIHKGPSMGVWCNYDY